MLNTFSLNTLRAFEASFRHLSFTRAGEELGVTQAAVSHRVKALEKHFDTQLFRRTTRGIIPTDEAVQLAPAVSEAFARMSEALTALADSERRTVISLSAVGTFAIGFLADRLAGFAATHPSIDLRLQTNNNLVDIWIETLDFAIRYADGPWTGVDAQKLLSAPLTPLCTPKIAAALSRPSDLSDFTLLRSFRTNDWPLWLNAAQAGKTVARGPIFDSSITMVQYALAGKGIALAPPAMFKKELMSGSLVQPFELEVGDGAYWLAYNRTKSVTAAAEEFRAWLMEACASL